MRDEQAFVQERRPAWQALEELLSTRARSMTAEQVIRLGQLYREVCADLIRSRSNFSPDLVRYLDALAARAHNEIYRAAPLRRLRLWPLLCRFPIVLRRNWQPQLLAAIMFCAPLLIAGGITLVEPDLASEMLSPQQLMHSAEMYEGTIEGREAGQDARMAGFYVFNNIGIAFRCFATGIFFGIGSVFFLLYNGLSIGVTVAHVINSGSGGNILTFICSHAPYELTAIVISGGAGIQLGYALVATGGLTRIASLRRAAPDVFVLISGAAAMLLVAALIEGFWSPSALPAELKFGSAVLSSVLVAGFFVFAGRGGASRARVEGQGR